MNNATTWNSKNAYSRNVNNMEITIEQTEAGSGNFFQFNPDVYDAVVADISEIDNPFEEDKTQLQFEFEVPGYLNEDGSVATKRGYANPVWNSKSKLWAWALAILGKEPEAGEAFRTSALIGKPCRIVLNAGKNMKGEPVIKLTDVLGPKVAAPKKAGLVERLKADPPAGTTVELCTAKGCKQPLTMYDADGEGFCEKHRPDDE